MSVPSRDALLKPYVEEGDLSGTLVKKVKRVEVVVPPAPQERPYDLTGIRHDKFLELLRPPKQMDTIRIGCTGAKTSV
jgi:hypothetical protein